MTLVAALALWFALFATICPCGSRLRYRFVRNFPFAGVPPVRFVFFRCFLFPLSDNSNPFLFPTGSERTTEPFDEASLDQ